MCLSLFPGFGKSVQVKTCLLYTSVQEEKIGQRMVTITTKGKKLVPQAEEDGELYREYKKPVYEDVLLQWIPYYAWANRGEGEMQVFIKTNR